MGLKLRIVGIVRVTRTPGPIMELRDGETLTQGRARFKAEFPEWTSGVQGFVPDAPEVGGGDWYAPDAICEGCETAVADVGPDWRSDDNGVWTCPACAVRLHAAEG